MQAIIENGRNLWKMLNFVFGGTGKEYGISIFQKLKLTRQMLRNSRAIKALSTWQQHLVLVEEIFNTPKSVQGDVIECGCFNGASTATLSLACGLANRKLFVCDSFEGLSEPTEKEEYEVGPVFSDYLLYKKGDYSADGGLEGVKNNVARYGNPDVCTYVKGFFADSLPDIETESIIMVFEDADLPSAVEDCLKHLWPKLLDGCKFYCHEPWSVKVVSVFFNEQWWLDNLETHFPGFYGSGDGIVPGMGYAKKFSAEQIVNEGNELELSFKKDNDSWTSSLAPKA